MSETQLSNAMVPHAVRMSFLGRMAAAFAPGPGREQRIANLYHPQLDWNGPHPVNHCPGRDAVSHRFWGPLLKAMPDLERRHDICIAGHWKEGIWIAATGVRRDRPHSGSGDAGWGYLGASAFGPATGKQVQVRTIADCLVENGVITREWLAGERSRVLGGRKVRAGVVLPWSSGQTTEFAISVLDNAWRGADSTFFEVQYAPYAVLHESKPVASGRRAVVSSYAALRNMVGPAVVSVDHVCAVPNNTDGHEVAVRWMLAGEHRGDSWGLAASGAPLLIMGVTHWQIVAGQIAAEWTIFDKLAVLAQIYRHLQR